MRSTRRQYPATHKPPKAASVRGLQAAMAVLYGEQAPMPADLRSQVSHALEQAPYRKRQRELALVLSPEPDPR